MVRQETLSVITSGHKDIHDLTPQVTGIVRNSGIKTGIAHIFVEGSTGAIGLMECEVGLKQDLPRVLDGLVPPSPEYKHEATWSDGNGHSHLQATLLGQSVTIPVADGQPLLGTWQQVFLLECDIKPRKRLVVVTVLGEA